MLKLMMLDQVNCMLAGQILIVRDDEFNEKCTCTFYNILVFNIPTIILYILNILYVLQNKITLNKIFYSEYYRLF